MNDFQDFLCANYNRTEQVGVLHIGKDGVKNSVCTVGSLARCQEPDTYMTMNPLRYQNHKINRNQEHIARLKWLYVDLDYYHSAYKDYQKKQIAGLLEMDYYNQKIPVPTYVVDSGRGLYLLWRLDEHIKAYPRWVKMQRYLCDTLKEFGADAKVVSDSARVLRKIGSINSKSGTIVTVMEHQDVKYSLTNLIREYLDPEEKRPSKKMLDYAKGISNILQIPLPDVDSWEDVRSFIRKNKEPANLFYQGYQGQKECRRRKKAVIRYHGTQYSLFKSRISDLETLVSCRSQMTSQPEEGSREYLLFLYRYWMLCITDDKEQSLIRTLELNARMRVPLSEHEVRISTKSAERYFDAGKVFNCTNAHIIDVLHITTEEMEKMSILIDRRTRKMRKKLRNKEAYLERLKESGKETKEEEKRKRLEQLDKLLKEGKSRKEICLILCISKSTYYNDKKTLGQLSADAEEAPVVVEKNKKTIMEHLRKSIQERMRDIKMNIPKFSAFVLNKSFRTCPFRVLSGGYLSMWLSTHGLSVSDLGFHGLWCNGYGVSCALPCCLSGSVSRISV